MDGWLGGLLGGCLSRWLICWVILEIQPHGVWPLVILKMGLLWYRLPGDSISQRVSWLLSIISAIAPFHCEWSPFKSFLRY